MNMVRSSRTGSGRWRRSGSRNCSNNWLGELAARDETIVVGAGAGALRLIEIEYNNAILTGRELQAGMKKLEGKRLT